MELSTRRVEIGGIASQVNGLWMAQIARNLTDGVDGFFQGKRYLIHDRDPLYTRDFLNLLADAGIESVTLPPRSPQPERLCGALREDDQGKLFGSDDLLWRESLRRAIHEFVVHYHQERNHQGLENRLIIPMEKTTDTALAIERRQRLGRLLNYYYRAA
jgi:putative transposase